MYMNLSVVEHKRYEKNVLFCVQTMEVKEASVVWLPTFFQIVICALQKNRSDTWMTTFMIYEACHILMTGRL